MKNKNWFSWVVLGCYLVVSTIAICMTLLWGKQRDKIEELERQIGVMYFIEDSHVIAVDYDKGICYAWYGDMLLELEIEERILHTDIRVGDIAYFISNYDLTDAVLVAIQHYDD